MSDKKCILAFTALYVAPNGDVRPCCISKPFKNPVKWKENSTIEEMYNSEQFKQLRKDMVDGIEPDTCDYCFKRGHNLRNSWNQNWKDKLNDINLYNEDYSINKLQYLDIRYSNLCNFKCRMCAPDLSSAWFEDYVEIHGEQVKNRLTKFIEIGDDSVTKFTEKDLEGVEHLYFAGGEPFINEDFYKMIDRFPPEVAKNMSVYINTNLSTLYYKKNSILNVLKKFKKVGIGTSCDGYGEIGEYQRTGFSHETFCKNFKELLEYSKIHRNITVEIECTITTINVFHIFDFVEFLKSNFQLDESAIHCHYAITPYYWSVNAAPAAFRKKVINYINDNLHTLQNGKKLKNSIISFLDFVNLEFNNTFNEKEIDIRKYVYTLDILRNTNYKEVCPWIEELFDHKPKLI